MENSAARKSLAILVLVLIGTGAPPGDTQEPVRSEPAKGEVDLLGLIDPSRDAVVGIWRKTEGVLVTSWLPNAFLQIPYSPPEEYDLRVSCARLGGPESLNLGLVAGGKRFQVILDGWGGSVTGVHRVLGRAADGNATTVRGALFTQGVPAAVVCSVRSNRLTARVCERTAIDWEADFRQVSNDDNWEPPLPDALFVGSHRTSYPF